RGGQGRRRDQGAGEGRGRGPKAHRPYHEIRRGRSACRQRASRNPGASATRGRRAQASRDPGGERSGRSIAPRKGAEIALTFPWLWALTQTKARARGGRFSRAVRLNSRREPRPFGLRSMRKRQNRERPHVTTDL